MSDVPQMPGIPVELFDIETNWDNEIEVTLQFEDATQLTVEFGPQSQEAAELLAVLTRLVNDRLRVIASRGVDITGFVPPEEDKD